MLTKTAALADVHAVVGSPLFLRWFVRFSTAGCSSSRCPDLGLSTALVISQLENSSAGKMSQRTVATTAPAAWLFALPEWFWATATATAGADSPSSYSRHGDRVTTCNFTQHRPEIDLPFAPQRLRRCPRHDFAPPVRLSPAGVRALVRFSDSKRSRWCSTVRCGLLRSCAMWWASRHASAAPRCAGLGVGSLPSTADLPHNNVHHQSCVGTGTQAKAWRAKLSTTHESTGAEQVGWTEREPGRTFVFCCHALGQPRWDQAVPVLLLVLLQQLEFQVPTVAWYVPHKTKFIEAVTLLLRNAHCARNLARKEQVQSARARVESQIRHRRRHASHGGEQHKFAATISRKRTLGSLPSAAACWRIFSALYA